MRSFVLVAVVVSASFMSSVCQQQLDAATNDDVQQMLTLSGARERVQLLWQNMAQQSASTAAEGYRLKHPDATPLQLRKVAEITGEYMQNIIKTFSVDELMDAIVPVYQRHLTHADVQSIIAFYNSESGQKLLKETPAMMTESMQAVDPILRKRLPDIVAAAEKAAEEQTKAGVGANSSGTTPR